MLNSISISLSDITQIITALVALAGLALSIFNIVLRQNDRKTKVKITVGNGFLTYPTGLSEPMLLFDIANHGLRKTVINSLSACTGIKQNFLFLNIDGTETIPFVLEPGRSVKMWYPLDEFKKYLASIGLIGRVKVKFIITDELSNKFIGYTENFHRIFTLANFINPLSLLQ